MLKKLLNLKKLNIFVFTLVILIFFQIIIFRPTLFWILSFFIFLIIIFSVWNILPKNISIRREFKSEDNIFLKLKIIFKIIARDRNYTFFISPLFFFLGILFFIFFLNNKILIQLSIFFFIFLYFLLLEGLYFYFYKKESYFLENIFTVINFTALFLIYFNLFFFLTIFSISFWLIIILFLFFTFLSNHQIFYMYRILGAVNYFYNIIITIIMVEIFWSLTFLPTSFYVNSLVLLSVYYSIMGIIYFHLKETLNRLKIVRHLLITLTVIFITFSTARWF